MAGHFKSKEERFDQKIEELSKLLKDRKVKIDTPAPTTLMEEFSIVSPLEFAKLIASSNIAGSQDDPCPQDVSKKLARTELVGNLILEIVNCSLSWGIMPTSLKTSHIKPLLKKAGLDLNPRDNFRAIVNSRFLAKIIEKIAASQISNHLEAHKLLNPSQAGFRPKHGTEAVIISLWDDLKRQVDMEGAAALILLDLSAAFDTVEHTTLLSRMKEIGITGRVTEWVNSFLRNRQTQVSAKPFSSDSYSPRFGVPQGSPISPVLFNIYLRPLAEIIRSHNLTCYNYADDTQIVIKIHKNETTPCQSVENCLLSIAKWMTDSHLVINPGKTELLLCGQRDLVPNPFPWPTELGPAPEPLATINSLGFIVSEYLDPEEQAKITSKQCFHRLTLLKKIIPLLSYPQQVTATVALVLSKLDYVNGIFAGATEKSIKILQRVQNHAARMLTKVGPREHITPALTSLNWLPVARRVTFKILCYTHQAIQGKGPAFLNEKIQVKTNARSLRNSNEKLLIVPKTRTIRTGDASFSVQAAKLWNQLPKEIRDIEGIPAFKKAAKTWLFITWRDG